MNGVNHVERSQRVNTYLTIGFGAIAALTAIVALSCLTRGVLTCRIYESIAGVNYLTHQIEVYYAIAKWTGIVAGISLGVVGISNFVHHVIIKKLCQPAPADDGAAAAPAPHPAPPPPPSGAIPPRGEVFAEGRRGHRLDDGEGSNPAEEGQPDPRPEGLAITPDAEEPGAPVDRAPPALADLLFAADQSDNAPSEHPSPLHSPSPPPTRAEEEALEHARDRSSHG